MFQISQIQFPSPSWIWGALILLGLGLGLALLYSVRTQRFKLRIPAAFLDRLTQSKSRALANNDTRDGQTLLRLLTPTSRPAWLSPFWRGAEPSPSAIVLSTKARATRALIEQSELGFVHRQGLLATELDAEGEQQDPLGWAAHEDFVLLTLAERYCERASRADSREALFHALSKTPRLEHPRYLLLLIQHEDLDGRTRQDIKELAQGLGQQVQRMHQTFGLRIPVYLLVDGLEALPGFLDFLDALEPSESEGVWGWTLDNADPQIDRASSIKREHQRFLNRLEARTTQHILEQAAPEVSARHYQFIQALDGLTPPLLDLTRDLLSCRFAEDEIPLAGLLFTSTRAQAQKSSGTQPGVFTRQLFPAMNQAHLRPLALATPRQRSQTMRRRLAAGVGLLAIATLWVGPLVTSQNNRAIQQELNQLLSSVKSPSGPGVTSNAWTRAAELEQHLTHLRHHPSLNLGLGMSQVPVLQEAAATLFLRLTLRHAIDPVLAQDETVLRGLLEKPAPLRFHDIERARISLFRYLLLSQTALSSSQPPLDEKRSASLANALQRAWRTQPLNIHPEQASRIAQRYVAYLGQNPSLLRAQDASLVQKVRLKLQATDIVARFAQDGIATTNQKYPALALEEVLDPDIATNKARVVPAAFTAQGWTQSIQPRLSDFLATYEQDAWVLGVDGPRYHRHEMRRAFQHLYASTFLRAWRDFLLPLSLQGWDSPLRAKATLTALSHRSDSPWHRLSSLLEQHLSSLELETNEPLPAQAHTPFAELRAQFLPILAFAPSPPETDQAQAERPGVAAYQELLAKLAALRETPGDPHHVQLELQSLQEQSAQLASLDTGIWADWFESLLGAPFEARRNLAKRQANKALAQDWCELASHMRSKIFSRYPFRAGSGQEVSPEELAEFLHPTHGRFWEFVEQSGLELRRDEDRIIQETSASTRLHQRWLRFANAAWRVSRELFPGQVDLPTLEYRVQIESGLSLLDAFVQIDEMRYHPDKTRHPAFSLKWPAERAELRTRIRVRHPHGVFRVERQGIWSLLRTLESGHSQALSASGMFSVSWPLKGASGKAIRLKLRSTNGAKPLFAVRRAPMMALFRTRYLQGPIPLFRRSIPCM